jgi:threonine dehydrogenase-like Zn-dependent dehydrogenase
MNASSFRLRHIKGVLPNNSRLPDGVSLTMGALVEPLAVAMHASRRASLPTGSTVLVFGAGSVGLLCAAISKTRGHSVIIADIQAQRVDFAVSNGFADAGIIVPLKQCDTIDMKLKFAKMVAVIVAGTHLETGEVEKKVGEVDAVFECTGQESCLQSAIYVSPSSSFSIIMSSISVVMLATQGPHVISSKAFIPFSTSSLFISTTIFVCHFHNNTVRNSPD